MREETTRARLLIAVVFFTALAGIFYELILGTVSTLLLGDSVREWSLTIGVFLFAMGIGSWLSGRIEHDLLKALLRVQLGLAVVGALSPLALFIVFAWFEPATRGVMIGVLLMLGTGIGVEIPLLTRLLKDFGSFQQALAHALAVDYLGALVASLAFPLVFYPMLGLVRTAILTGGINLLAVGLLVFAFEHQLRNKLRLWAVVGVLGLAGGALFAKATVLSSFAQQKLYGGEIVWAEVSKYQDIALVRHPRGDDFALFLNRHIQFSSRDEARYHQPLVHVALGAGAPPTTVLVLGGGDGLVVREVLRWESVTAITLVDLDPAMLRLARHDPRLVALNEGSLSDARVTVIEGDAARWLMSHSQKFDRVIIDLPDPSTPGLARLYSEEFYRSVADHLDDGGLMVTQATSPYYTRRSFWCIERSVAAAGLVTLPYHRWVPSFGEWGFVLAGKTPPRPVLPEIDAPHLEPWDALFQFPPDMARSEEPVNRMLDPVLSSIYGEEVRLER